MSGRKNNLTVESNLVLNVLRKFAYNCSRHRYRLEHLFVVSKHIDQFIIPVICRRIHKLSCCRICIFVFLHTCQQEMEVIRNHQDCFRLLEVLRMSLFYSHQLIDCVKRLLLDTCSLIQCGKGNFFIHFFIHSVRTTVTVAYCISEDLILLIKKHIVNSPSINSHCCRDFSKLFTFLQSVLDLCKKTIYIPA